MKKRNFNRNKGKGNNNNYNNRGKSGGGGGGGGQTSNGQWPTGQPPAGGYYWPPQQWPMPFCSYPTRQWQQRPTTPRPDSGILDVGPRPQQAYSMHGPTYSGYTPTDVEAAMHTLSMHQPDDNWYMNTGATFHMTANSGTLTSYFNLSNNSGIIVGNGSTIPIRSYGHTSLPPPNPQLRL